MAEHDPQDGDAIVQAEGLTKTFGDEHAVRHLSLQITPGTVFGFIGPSGCGKTTTVRMLTGILRPTSGTARVFGTPPHAFSTAERARIGYMPQLSVLYPPLSLWENLNFVGSIYGMPLRRRSRLRRALEFVELYDDRKKRLKEASGGMQRRLALAASLVHDPEVVFLDEPTAGIDPVLRRKFWDHFEDLKQQGRTLFVTTQYVGEAAYCDKIGVMSEGRLLMVETPQGLRDRAFGGEILQVVATSRIDEATVAELRTEDFVIDAERQGPEGRSVRLVVDHADTAIPKVQHWFEHRRADVKSVQQDLPPFDDVFVKLVEEHRAHAV